MADNNEAGLKAVASGDQPLTTEPYAEALVASSKSTKSPAFQFYPTEFLADDNVDQMSMTERGIYITLMSKYWIIGNLPSDRSELARMCRMKAVQFDRIWLEGPLHLCFHEKDGRLIQKRLEAERHKQAEFRRRQSDNGALGGRPKKPVAFRSENPSLSDPKSSLSLSLSSSLSSTSSLSEKKEESAEPHADSSPVLLTFPTQGAGPKTWDLTEARIAEWATAYPGIDVLAECRKALVWVQANGPKTSRGMPSFLVRWLNQAVDRGTRIGVPQPKPARPSHVEAWKQIAKAKP